MPFDGSDYGAIGAAMCLRLAKDYLINRGWSDCGPFGPNDSVCIDIAIIHVLSDPPDSGISGRDRIAARRFMNLACGNGNHTDGALIGQWNDTPGRTLEEVLAAFDRAIALAETA